MRPGIDSIAICCLILAVNYYGTERIEGAQIELVTNGSRAQPEMLNDAALRIHDITRGMCAYRCLTASATPCIGAFYFTRHDGTTCMLLYNM